MNNLTNIESYKSLKSFTAFFDRLLILGLVVILPIIMAVFSKDLIISYSVSFLILFFWIYFKYWFSQKQKRVKEGLQLMLDSGFRTQHILLNTASVNIKIQNKKVQGNNELFHIEDHYEKSILMQLDEVNKVLRQKALELSTKNEFNSEMRIIFESIDETIKNLYKEEYRINNQKRYLSKIQLQKIMYSIFEIQAIHKNNRFVVSDTETVKFLIETLINQMNFYDNYTIEE